jgi:hypothetical protein
MFDASVAAFQKYMGANMVQPAPSRPPTDKLLHVIETENDYSRPLALQIAALLNVAGVDPTEGAGIATLLDKILGLEYEPWDKVLNFGQHSNFRTAVKNGVAQVTLVGSVDNRQAAEALMSRDPLYRSARDIDVLRVSGALASIFPGENDGLVGLEPDLIGERHVVNIATDELVAACIDWADDDRERRQQILTVLNRASRADHGARASCAEA